MSAATEMSANAHHVCGEYAVGFRAALETVRARLDAQYEQVRDGVGALSRHDVLRLLHQLGDALADGYEQRPVNKRGGRNGRERKAAA